MTKAAAKDPPGRRAQRRDATGQLVERHGTRGMTWGIRFRMPGGRRSFTTVGRSWEGCDRREAERRAGVVLAQARLGQWRTPEDRERERQEREAARAQVPLFSSFARTWLGERIALGGRDGSGLSPAGAEDLEWRVGHLEAWFGGMPLDAIDPREVEAYALAKRTAAVGVGGLGASSTNKTLGTLEAILRRAVRHGVIDRNAVDGYRVPGGSGARRTYVDHAEGIAALLDAAGDLDAERAARSRAWRRPFLAMLALGGPRIAEAMAVTWSDLDLARGRLRIRGTKTDAADRWVDLVPLLHAELATYAAASRHRDPMTLMFGAASGRVIGASNVRRRCLAPSVERANARLAEDRHELLPALTPHGLRRTAASVWFGMGWDLPTVMASLGHRSERMTLSVYARSMRSDPQDRERLRALVGGAQLDPSAPAIGRIRAA